MTARSRFHNPVDVHFGAGALAHLPALVGERRAVLVTMPEARSLGMTGQVEALLGRRLAGVIDQVSPNPDVRELAPMYGQFWREYAHCEVIVALGGGSALDTAKLLMVAGDDERFGTLVDALEAREAGGSFRPTRTKRLITIPTTAGTGSEVTPWATLWDRHVKRRKYSLHLPQTWPEAAIVDPRLTRSLPGAITLQSGLDALSHALEAIWNVNANPISDTFAVAAARDMMHVLPQLMAALDDEALRSRAALAALQAGLAFSNTKTALAHSISYDMTIRHGLPHGIACSFTLPAVMRLAIGRRPDRDAVLAQVFDGDIASAPARLTAFLNGLGVATEFAAYGVSEPESSAMIAAALDGPRGRNFIGAAA
ncbi:iron-containing alcohol dehydrogenase [Pandoraea nosoerga]|uniref:Alcohol dehydrogenase n=1 Tax=Pandoraea nosoerga TaxID=2508296 RepID=A0A5E4UCL8_9BURK|nr:iron-containing alcohol dehydrogenase PsrA [Pandoraea nosoerga]MBN4667129.1 iron-containing alcohol dehydrogenase [Pandoraea nosoerga]MBN4677117.1 iron-containing alcohol dehydrogenase [Pandoraea nosoerga]MBN4681846.1 iron-containing alcohol dehydrogenase [Pandoraea nosoerga]MBN4746234.1 iron-containing alcohol dehydrogenase [Pandoraea nosoerga]VVD97785.1 alcohol dehydrogenase [Pandoraea nosoerga]